jgi:hypothetical protein
MLAIQIETASIIGKRRGEIGIDAFKNEFSAACSDTLDV